MLTMRTTTIMDRECLMPDDWDTLHRIYSGSVPAIITLALYFPTTESQMRWARAFYRERDTTRSQARRDAIAAHFDANRRSRRRVEV